MKKETLVEMIRRVIREESETSLKNKVINLYKKKVSQADISDQLGVDIMKVAAWTKNLGIHVGKDDFDDDRIGDDPSSKQYYDRVIKR